MSQPSMPASTSSGSAGGSTGSAVVAANQKPSTTPTPSGTFAIADSNGQLQSYVLVTMNTTTANIVPSTGPTVYIATTPAPSAPTPSGNNPQQAQVQTHSQQQQNLHQIVPTPSTSSAATGPPQNTNENSNVSAGSSAGEREKDEVEKLFKKNISLVSIDLRLICSLGHRRKALSSCCKVFQRPHVRWPKAEAGSGNAKILQLAASNLLRIIQKPRGRSMNFSKTPVQVRSELQILFLSPPRRRRR